MYVRISIALLLAAALDAQTPVGQLAFEAASIKPAPPPDFSKTVFFGCRGGPGTDDPTLFACTNTDLSDLISKGYGLPYYRMPNHEAFDKVRFQVNLRTAPGTTAGQFQLMMQNLLAERFKLAVHREMKEMSTFQLLVAKGGPKFKASEADAKPPEEPKMPPATIRLPARKWTMDHFADWLSGYAKGPVINATGLAGEYDFVLWWSFDTLDNPDAGPDMFQALQSQLGLKLEAKKGPIEVLVIDHAEKIPTEN